MKTLFDKIWDAHTVDTIAGGSCVLYIDRQYIHEVTSPQAFEGFIRAARKYSVRLRSQPAPITIYPHKINICRYRICNPPGNWSMLENNCTEHGITIFKVGTPKTELSMWWVPKQV